MLIPVHYLQRSVFRLMAGRPVPKLDSRSGPIEQVLGASAWPVTLLIRGPFHPYGPV